MKQSYLWQPSFVKSTSIACSSLFKFQKKANKTDTRASKFEAKSHMGPLKIAPFRDEQKQLFCILKRNKDFTKNFF